MNYTQLHNECARALQPVKSLEGVIQSGRTTAVESFRLIAAGWLEGHRTHVGRATLAAVHHR